MVRLHHLAVLAALAVASYASPTPHEGHHGFPGKEFNSTVIHSNDSHPHAQPSAGGHSHGHGGTPLTVLNETQVLVGHAPDPLSYISYDLYGLRQGYKSGWGDDAFDIVVYSGKSHGWLMVWHIIASISAYFFALPASIALRSAKHPLQPVAHCVFVALVLLSWFAAAAYRKVTPDLYAGSTHSGFGNWLTLLVLAVSGAEYIPKTVRFFRRFFAHVQRISERGGVVGKQQVVEAIQFGRQRDEDGPIALSDEAERLMEEEPKEVVFETAEWSNEPGGSGSSSPQGRQSHDTYPHPHQHFTRNYRPKGRHGRQLSTHSDFSDATTLHNGSPTSEGHLDVLREEEEAQELYRALNAHASTGKRSLRAKLAQFVRVLHFIWERLVVVLAYTTFVSGSVVYTGICRGNYLNGCLAHLIKGSIFFLYGVLTFSRYLGAFADMGWAWNRIPYVRGKRNPPSAELIESSVIFVYGATNTWMERFGAETGSPYTAKQIQHISIAVMYFFGGAIGIALELGKRGSTTHHSPDGDVQPYRSSYNPFAALCIGITGIAMAAHHQTYVFQVQIHMLWGTLLGLYGLARCLTYFSLWLNPPRSTEPSRPPTEALASFLLTGGGLAFISSTEQIGFWAMRSGRDDMMMFANVIVALSFLCFTWLFGILAFQGWAKRRMEPTVSPSSPSPSSAGSNTGRFHHARQRRAAASHGHHGVEFEMGSYGKKVPVSVTVPAAV